MSEHVPPTEAELDALRAENDQWRAEVKRLMDSALPEKAWLIEAAGDRPMWWNGDGASSNDFTGDANRAIRFATAESANIVIHHLLKAYSFALRPTSHLWFDEDAVRKARAHD